MHNNIALLSRLGGGSTGNRYSSGMTYVLNEGTLVLEGVTLAQVVELVVEVLVDLAGGTVADEETTENTHAAHPEDLAIERRSVSNRYFLQSAPHRTPP